MFIHEDEEFIEFCEEFGFNPEDEDSVTEYRIMLEDRYTNPHA